MQNLLRHEDVIAHRIHTRFVDEQVQTLLTFEPDRHQRLYFHQTEEIRGAASHHASRSTAPVPMLPEGQFALAASHRGTVAALDVQVGDLLQPGQRVAVLEAMKMEFLVEATAHGIVRQVLAEVGETVAPEQALLFLEPREASEVVNEQVSAVDLDALRPDLQEVRERHAIGLDEVRRQAVERRRKSGQRCLSTRQSAQYGLVPGNRQGDRSPGDA